MYRKVTVSFHTGCRIQRRQIRENCKRYLASFCALQDELGREHRVRLYHGISNSVGVSNERTDGLVKQYEGSAAGVLPGDGSGSPGQCVWKAPIKPHWI